MAWRKDAAERRSIWPYRVFQNHVKMEVTGILFKNRKAIATPFQGKNWRYEKRSLNSGFLRWPVFQENEVWDEIRFEFSLSLHKPELFSQEVFSSDAAPPCVFAIDAMCRSTRWRNAITVPYTLEKSRAALSVNRKMIAGTILFSPMILLWEERKGASAGQAMAKGARVATGFPFQVQIDPPLQKPGRGIEILWTPFPPEVSESLYELIIEPPKPILRINNQHPSLKVIFEDLSKIGNRARIRNALFSLIATDVWMQLSEYAVSVEELKIEDEEDASAILSTKILKTAMKMLKCSPEQILSAFEDPQARSALRLRFQHYFKALKRQDELITGLVPEDQIQGSFQ